MKKRKNICVVLGTRPEAIKLAPVITELKKNKQRFATLVVLTSQHRSLVDPLLRFFKIKPDFDLDVMKKNQNPSNVMSRVLQRIEKIYKEIKPDLVVVQGDTTSAVAAALAAFYEKIPVAHVEAGLRTTDIYNPFPEEINRRVISRIASFHFAATEQNRKNLVNEGLDAGAVYLTGNPVIDTMHDILKREKYKLPELPGYNRSNDRLIILTTHRRENFGEAQRNIFSAVGELLQKYQDIHLLFPVHPNPEVGKMLKKSLKMQPRLHIVDPLDYITFVRFMNRSYFVMTDSGGIQEEAPAMGKPVLILRVETERDEIIKTGNGILTGVKKEKIVAEAARLLEDKKRYHRCSKRSYPFGKGEASRKIIKIIAKRMTNVR